MSATCCRAAHGRAGWLLLGLAAGACQGPPPGAPGATEDPAGAAFARAQAVLRTGDAAAALPDLAAAAERSPSAVRVQFAYQDAARWVGGAAEQAMRARYAAPAATGDWVGRLCRVRLLDTAYERDRELRKLLEAAPASAFVQLALARNLRGEGRLVPAGDAYLAALRLDPALHEARWERAQVLAEIGRDDEAAAEYAVYLQQVPDHDVARRAYVGLLLYRLGRAADARRQLDVLEPRHPDDLDLWMDRAAALWLGGEPQRAVAKYLAVLERQPAAARALLDIGLLYYEVLATDPASRRRYWPAARAAFALFLTTVVAQDGHDAFERAVAVPFRLQRIQQLLGPASGPAPTLRDLRLESGG
jgi:tetratricopeptide (TPR) repeat protein